MLMRTNVNAVNKSELTPFTSQRRVSACLQQAPSSHAASQARPASSPGVTWHAALVWFNATQVMLIPSVSGFLFCHRLSFAFL